MQLVLATRNAHKVREMHALLVAAGFDVVGMDQFPALPEDLPESGDSFEHNAAEKARFVAAATGLPALADDSGLEVEALGWGPGVYSKRYSVEGTDEANNQRLLRDLAGVEQRRARYRCVLALALPSDPSGPPGAVATVDGACAGQIGHAPLGTGGFGYDPYFWPDDVPGRTMAELSLAEKNRISHRGRALARLSELLTAAGLG